MDRDEAELAAKIAALADAERKARDRKAAQEALARAEEEARSLRERLASEAKDEADAARMSQEISELHKKYQKKEKTKGYYSNHNAGGVTGGCGYAQASETAGADNG